MKEDDCQAALFRFDSGAIAKVAALYAPRLAMPPYNNLRVYGTKRHGGARSGGALEGC